MQPEGTNRQDEDQRIMPEQADVTGLPGGSVGRRGTSGDSEVYPLSSLEDAGPDEPDEREERLRQGKRRAIGDNTADNADSEESDQHQ